MPSALVSGLIAPLRELQAMVGTGTSDAAPALAAIRTALTDVAAATIRSRQQTRWLGDAGDAASDFTDATVAAIDALAARADHLGAAAADAADAVARARARLQTIVDGFEARAEALESRLDEPGVVDELIAEARRAMTEADAAIEDLRAELDGQRAAVAEPPSGALPTMPMGAGSGLGGLGAGAGAGSGLGGAKPSDSLPFDSRSDASAGPDAQPLSDPGMFGSGVLVRLPDGSTGTAPNAVAASAVRHALTQLGVPYDWGGTTPGVGLDCSGLTQWAYHEAGLDLPRLAQEQDVGAAVTQSTVRPGDLAVWDGHVAMVVGNGQMVEAGDPVKLSPIRTTNAGQGFQGFWRPTA
ncbi:C40 family peptidase [Mycobacterium antarcticum]|uniref:C40 family peptidase n=1 Tax=Mycolicibacterium sp. TUM20984 TaxID=3023368 RepID=UPI00238E1836|nr:C40 family peptidase [Mycolicibacterium sp. TUM20984]GLP82449.1 glycoside hydrolase [Mycolicibacterium sp. TUM20984]